jgi:hypothetical protein
LQSCGISSSSASKRRTLRKPKPERNGECAAPRQMGLIHRKNKALENKNAGAN